MNEIKSNRIELHNIESHEIELSDHMENMWIKKFILLNSIIIWATIFIFFQALKREQTLQKTQEVSTDLDLMN